MPEIVRDETTGPDGNPFPSQARVVVIGGGVVGCAILFHLAKFGWKDVVLLEREELTAASSWHAAGQIHTLSSDPNISRLQGYTISLYKEIEATSGQSVGLHETGAFYLASTRDWYDYLKRERSKARYMGLHQEFISPQEVARPPSVDRPQALLRRALGRAGRRSRPRRRNLCLCQFRPRPRRAVLHEDTGGGDHPARG